MCSSRVPRSGPARQRVGLPRKARDEKSGCARGDGTSSVGDTLQKGRGLLGNNGEGLTLDCFPRPTGRCIRRPSPWLSCLCETGSRGHASSTPCGPLLLLSPGPRTRSRERERGRERGSGRHEGWRKRCLAVPLYSYLVANWVPHPSWANGAAVAACPASICERRDCPQVRQHGRRGYSRI